MQLVVYWGTEIGARGFKSKGSLKNPPLSAAKKHGSPGAVSSLDAFKSLAKQHEHEYKLWVAQTHVIRTLKKE